MPFLRPSLSASLTALTSASHFFFQSASSPLGGLCLSIDSYPSSSFSFSSLVAVSLSNLSTSLSFFKKPITSLMEYLGFASSAADNNESDQPATRATTAKLNRRFILSTSWETSDKRTGPG